MSKWTPLFFLATTTATANAFSPEIFNQVIVQLGADGAQLQADELVFAAANYFSDGSRKIVLPLLSRATTPKLRRDNILLPGGIVGPLQFPKLAPSVYDSETRTVPGSLDLTLEEEALIQLLRNVRDEYSPRTTIRIAGGWVRDKLLYGRETPSRDIDLVLSDTSGKEFAQKVCKYVEEMRDDREDEDEDAFDVHIVQPSSSKGDQAGHLENASLIISGFDVDFCRLRYERYKNKDSRIPSDIGVASAVEDAWRRDLTINALYYNLNTNQVEDWTERGIRDLLLQRVSTPKAPLRTLLEDPTRILRAIRFAAQLSFDMSPGLIRAARDARVRNALQYKVSRDAVGAAIDEMLGTRARDPSRGIQLLMATNLIDVVFPLRNGRKDVNDETIESILVDRSGFIYQDGLNCLSRTQSLVTRIFLTSDFEWDISKRRFLWYAAFFKPVYEMMPTSESKRSRRQESAFYRLLDSLKRPKMDMQSIESILKGVEPIQMLLLEETFGNAIKSAKSSGILMEDATPKSSQWEELSELRWSLYSTFKPIGTMWKEALILALASSQQSMTDCVQQYKDFILLIENNLQLGTTLTDKNKLKLLLNGSQVQRALGRIEGRGFRDVMHEVEEWQIRNLCGDAESMDDYERSEVETQLIDHLIATFPEYANRPNVAELEPIVD
eukprot:CAMPEP_0183708126 /NCGR_PEP_ID=MMETSP0737-20130205/4503_1 /TAXON_ID=385413 /ORGANISM="Thalassiosira miniscula, Strain CCMP1093" /LENGTH=668 /DNA_ID=CAMNT_0025935933 /DNA_START=200 /DNA_END=2206 /DNA_ORIENTATION=+